ncbi:MAG: hypothetical protein LQ345_006970 [Seirophora villosa]|nr:MAG: hypothetical protein LQ345_006970 [Seirophora villosa]
MKLLLDCWIAILDLFNAITLSPSLDLLHKQQAWVADLHTATPHAGHDGPVFAPPAQPQDPGEVLTCDYSPMGPGGQQFDISTDYETKVPTGITRKYTLVADEMNITADGVLMPYGKVFNQQYPGPWIQITVKNKLTHNGTTIHWHGLRQYQTLEHDGVNAITQCPIAPGDSYTYRFRAMQYGTTWYHSHYSLQYGDGMAGPLTIHGPSSSDYDDPRDPILMTDWNHRSGFQDFQEELLGQPPVMDSILLNGQGSFAGGARNGYKYNVTVTRGKKYLLRLINTSVATTFVFAIDRHNITVMSSDFVPIQPYSTDHVVVGIGRPRHPEVYIYSMLIYNVGQRYHVVVEASPKKANGEADLSEAFWMRTIPATGCSNFQLGGIPDERQGILYYKKDSTEYPSTPRAPFSIACRDESFNQLQPVLPWKVPKPSNPDLIGNDTLFEVGLDPYVEGQGHPLPNDAFVRWAMAPKAMYLNFSDPTVLNLRNTKWNPDYAVIPKDYPEDSWIYMVIYTNRTSIPSSGRRTVPAAHPQSAQGFDVSLLTPKYDNPPRRDVVLLPANGFIAIAFKADNPGSWLLHCHIAWHASSGLAMQILERQEAAAQILTPQRLEVVKDGCRKWNEWFSNPDNLWDKNVTIFQDDSGI